MNDQDLADVFHGVPLDVVQLTMRLYREALPQALRRLASLSAKAEAEVSARRLRRIQRSDMMTASVRLRWLWSMKRPIKPLRS